LGYNEISVNGCLDIRGRREVRTGSAQGIYLRAKLQFNRHISQ
jgi:hypothetical protein